MKRALIAIGCVVALVSGCGGGGTSAYVAPELDADTLRGDAIAVLGVTSLAGPDDFTNRVTMRQSASSTLRNARPDLEWIDASDVWIALEPDLAIELLDAYRTTARLGPREIEALSVLDERARYVWLARVDLDLDRIQTDHQIRDAGDRIVADVQVRARREMTLTSELFDLRTQRLVFSVQHQRVDTNPGPDFQVEPLRQPPTQQEIDRAIRDELERAILPEAPSRVLLLERLVRAAAADLPGQP